MHSTHPEIQTGENSPQVHFQWLYFTTFMYMCKVPFDSEVLAEVHTVSVCSSKAETYECTARYLTVRLMIKYLHRHQYNPHV